MSNIVSWWTVDNKVKEILRNGSLRHTLQKAKKIQRRTRVLNTELKKYAGLKSYREYVTIKTDILRNIPDNEDTDDEPLARAAIEATSFINDERYSSNDLSEGENEEEAEEHRESRVVTSPQKKLQPKITCTEIVKSKYTIVRDAEERQNVLNKSHDEPAERQDEVDAKQNVLVEPQDGLDEMQIELAKRQEELEKIQYNLMDENHDDPIETQEQQISNMRQEPMDDYYEVEDRAPVDLSIDDDDEETGVSSEARRVSRLRRFNLLYENSESDSSEDFDFLSQKRYTGAKESSHSQTISNPSDSEEQKKAGMRTEVDQSKASNYAPSLGSSFHISDSDDDNVKNVIGDCTKKKSGENPVKNHVRKSLRSQIDEQETIDFQNEIIRHDAPKVNNKVSTAVPSEAESLRYVLRNLSTNDIDVAGDSSRHDFIQDQNVLRNRIETLSRPMELEEFIEREELISTRESFTINLKDIKSWSEQDGDEEIWLMEIPRSIVTDRELCGKRIGLKRDKMKIDDVSYKSISRHYRPVSCILSTGKKRGRFTTVNIKPVGSIVVCHESSETRNSATASQQIGAVNKSADLVPFPSNVKSRNPLMALNTLEQQPKLDSSSLSDIRIVNKPDSVKKKKPSKKQKSNVITNNIIRKISKKFNSSRPKK